MENSMENGKTAAKRTSSKLQLPLPETQLPVKDTTFDAFCERVQVHGLLDWHQAKSHCAKAFWFFLIVVFLFVLIYGVVMSVKEYYTNPIITTVSITPNGSLWFPEVYVCPTMHRDYRKKGSLYDDELSKYLRERNQTSLLGDTNSVWRKLQPLSAMGGAGAFWGNQPDPEPSTIGNFRKQMESISYDVADIIPRCEFEGYQIDCQDIVYPMVDKDNGLCYKVKVDRAQRTAGIGLRLLIDLDVDQPENDEDLPPPFDGAYIGVSSITDPFKPLPAVVGPGTYVKMDMGIQYEELITVTYSETPQVCQSIDANRKYKVLRGPYSDQFCSGDCIQAAVLKHCGCLMMIDPSFVQERFYDKFFCKVEEVKNCAANITSVAQNEISECAKECYKGCQSWDISVRQSAMSLGSSRAVDLYESKKDDWEDSSSDDYSQPAEDAFEDSTVTSTTPPPENPYDERNKLQDPRHWRKSLVLLDVSFGATHYTSIVQSRAKTVPQLLSDIGGQTGLWLGCSIFSLIQLVVLVAGYFYTTADQEHGRRSAVGSS